MSKLEINDLTFLVKRFLSKAQRVEILDEHLRESNKKYADQIKSFLVIDDGWILKGEKKDLRTNSGRQRLNLFGALDVENSSLDGGLFI